VEDPENFLTMLQGDLLSVSAVGHRFSLIVLELDMTEQRVGQVLHNEPLDLRSHKKTNIISQREKRGHRGKVRADLEMSLPLILSPNIAGVIVVDMRHHLGHALKVPASIVAEEKEDRPVLGVVLKGAVKPAISLWQTKPIKQMRLFERKGVSKKEGKGKNVPGLCWPKWST